MFSDFVACGFRECEVSFVFNIYNSYATNFYMNLVILIDCSKLDLRKTMAEVDVLNTSCWVCILYCIKQVSLFCNNIINSVTQNFHSCIDGITPFFFPSWKN